MLGSLTRRRYALRIQTDLLGPKHLDIANTKAGLALALLQHNQEIGQVGPHTAAQCRPDLRGQIQIAADLQDLVGAVAGVHHPS